MNWSEYCELMLRVYKNFEANRSGSKDDVSTLWWGDE